MSTCRSARTVAGTATSSRSSAGRARTRAYVDALLAELALERQSARRRTRDRLHRRRNADLHRPRRARATATRSPPGRRVHGRGEPGDGDTGAGGAPVAEPRQSRVDRRAVVPRTAAGRTRAPRGTRRRPPRSASFPRCRNRQHLARPHLRHPRPEPRRSRTRPGRGARPRAAAPVLLRARGQARDALHTYLRG